MEEIFKCFSFSSLISSIVSLNMYILFLINKSQLLKKDVLQDTFVSNFQITISLSRLKRKKCHHSAQ